jgi:hypothetical protein
MSNSVAITPPPDRFPAQRCLLLAVIATFAFGIPATADARSKGRQTVGSAPVVTPAEPAKTMAASAVTPASLRAANDSVGPKAIVDKPTGAIRGAVTAGKTSIGKASGATTADAVPEPLPSASPQRPKDWYPESHSYLRPYHYKWRYWTPG